MKEMFRSWKKQETIKITYTDGTGAKKVWIKNQAELLRELTGILLEYADQNITLTSRQLYYQLVSRDIIPNSEETYKRVCSFLTDARYGGLIDWEAIEDRGRVPSIPLEFNDINERIQMALRNFRLTRWKDQDYYVELYCEKQAMESVLKPVADKFHIVFGVNKGYSSASTMYDLAQRVKTKIQEGKKAIVLYLGDHDASGSDMVRDIRERISEFITKGDEPVINYDEYYQGYYDDEGKEVFLEDKFEVVPLALNMVQIKKYNPPPNPAKMTDPRAKWYIAKYGNKSWELDALEPKVLIKIAEEGIIEYLDVEKYGAWIERENKEKQALKEFAEKLVKKEKKRIKGDE